MPKVLKGLSCTLAEGPLYHKKNNSFYCVDIKEKKIHAYSLTTQTIKTYELFKEIGTFSFTDKNRLIVALEDGLYYFDLKSEKLDFITNPEEDLANNRFNDGKCDKMGRFFVGSMDNFEKEITGSLYMYEHNIIRKIETNFAISNGLGWNKNNTKFYLTDSPKRVIYKYDYDLESGNISNKKVFATIDEKDGYPDGLCLDSEDNIYSAHWAGFKITKYNSNGKILDTIALPVPNVSSCCFGGENLDTLFITTAKKGLSQQELEKYPQSGSIFTKKMPMKGQEFYTFKEA